MGEYTAVIILALVGFVAVAFLLLAPVYRFLQREEEASKQWTRQALARRLHEEPPPENGTEDTEIGNRKT